MTQKAITQYYVANADWQLAGYVPGANTMSDQKVSLAGVDLYAQFLVCLIYHKHNPKLIRILFSDFPLVCNDVCFVKRDIFQPSKFRAISSAETRNLSLEFTPRSGSEAA
jgi:hypothetical protein